jgi:hypothetical protein
MKREDNEGCLSIRKLSTVFKSNISSRERVKFINFYKSLFSMFGLRSKTAEDRVNSFVGELLGFKELIHILEKFDLQFGFIGVSGPLLKLSSDDDMNMLPFGGVE